MVQLATTGESSSSSAFSSGLLFMLKLAEPPSIRKMLPYTCLRVSWVETITKLVNSLVQDLDLILDYRVISLLRPLAHCQEFVVRTRVRVSLFPGMAWSNSTWDSKGSQP